ncbi:response regulator [Lacrimispora sp.]|uniref:response regulator transcription factor n=1 Tax=Lacrimispora sp. TaxID=2719234 RepID=UPI0034616430
MYKVLIVDDEKLIREGLARHVDWNSLGMEVTGTAGHARQALESAGQNPPHILITDIRMPGQDGFELIQDILEMGLSPQTILISSYDDFIYAQRAIRFDIIRDYVLKPIDIDKFTEVLRSLLPYLEKQKTTAPVQDPLDIENYKSFLHDLRLANYDRNKLICLIKSGDTGRAMDFWAMACRTIADAHYPLATIRRFCTSLIGAILYSHNHKEADLLGTGLTEDPVKSVEETPMSLEELLDYMGRFIAARCFLAQSQRGSAKSRLISSCLDIIDREFCSCEFNLTSLAASLNVTPNYLSIKFKEELGIGFMKYLTEKQMEYAKALLCDVKYRVYEISNMVGFEDEKYFTRTFKKYQGVTPKEYREHHI